MIHKSDSTILKTPLCSRAVELSPKAFMVFCRDLAGMLGCDIAGSEKSKATVTLADLKNQFKKLVSVTSVQAKGAMNGSFYFILDQEAFVTLAGTLIMLPEEIIVQNRTECTLQSAAELGDAIGELGNLLVGSWNRVFRKELRGHGHFVLNKNFIGNPWNDAEGAIGLICASHLQIIRYEMKIKEFAPVNCAVVYPKDLFEGKLTGLESQEETIENMAADIYAAQTEAADNVKFEENTENADGVETPPHKNATEADPVETSLEPAAGQTGKVSESIRKMTASAAILPGQHNKESSISRLSDKTAQDIMRKDIIWASSEETIREALKSIKQNAIDYVLVGHNGLLEGVVSKSDIRGAMSPYLDKRFAQWRRPLDEASLQIRLKWVMSKPVNTISADASVASLSAQMSRQKTEMLPVVDSKGSVLGIVTAFDVLNVFSTLS